MRQMVKEIEILMNDHLNLLRIRAYCIKRVHTSIPGAYQHLQMNQEKQKKREKEKKETNVIIWDFNDFRWHEEINNNMCTVWTDMSTLLMESEQNTRSIVILKISKLWNNRLLKNTDFNNCYIPGEQGWMIHKVPRILDHRHLPGRIWNLEPFNTSGLTNILRTMQIVISTLLTSDEDIYKCISQGWINRTSSLTSFFIIKVAPYVGVFIFRSNGGNIP